MQRQPSRWCVLAVLPLILGASALAQDCLLWKKVADSGPSGRRYHAMAYDSARGRTVLFGGYDVSNNLRDDTWEWDGGKWTQVASGGPFKRQLHGMAYDSKRGRTVLFGGLTVINNQQTILGDTWEWDGAAWLKRADGGPVPRDSPAMAYDSARGRCVMFGGSAVGGVKDDTWEWDGAAWIYIPASGPAGREGAVMAYDSARQRSVMVGGLDSDFKTWEWDGSNWVGFNAGGPGGRGKTAMAYDAAAGVCVVLGGWFQGQLNDTQLWNGTLWTTAVVTPPPGRFEHAMAYDSLRDRVVIFGGSIAGSGYQKDTWEFQITSDPPHIDRQPTDQAVLKGKTATFKVVASANGQVDYRWRKNGNNLSDAGNIQGSYSNTLKVSNVQDADAGVYDVVITNACGTTTSDPAKLIVVCYADCDASLTLDIDDFICYQTLFGMGSFNADCNGDEFLDIDDFICFQTVFAAGCYR